jgi:3-dehydroquinate synthetase
VKNTCAFEFSTRLGLLPTNDAGRVAHHLATVGLPTHVSDVPALRTDADALMNLIAQDKKVKRGKLTFILSRGIGQAFVANDVDPAQVRAFLAEKLRA